MKLLSRKEEILLHLCECPAEHSLAMPLASSQLGIRQALGMSAASCCFHMAELESEGLVGWKLAHVPGLKHRTKAYVLTPDSDAIVKRAMAKLRVLEKAEGMAPELQQLQLRIVITSKAGK